MAIITRWHWPPISGGEMAEALGRVRNSDGLEELDGALAAFRLAEAEVNAQHFLDSEADREARVEAGEIEPGRSSHVLADDLAALGSGHAETGCGRRRPACRCDLGGPGRSPMAASMDGLAGAGSADDGQDSPAETFIDTPSRTAKVPVSGLNLTTRFSISEVPASGPLQFGIERIAQTVAHQVDGKNGDEDAQAGK